MGNNYLIIQGADFSANALKSVDIYDGWRKVAPPNYFVEDDYQENADPDYSFGTSDQIISGDSGYKLVEITWKNKRSESFDV